MARNRMLNPEFWLDEDIAKLSAHARLLYMGLWGICDDNYATFPNRPEWVKAQVFPYEEVDIRSLLSELHAKGKIILFISDDHHEFFHIKNFFKHQRVEKPSKPKYPEFKPHLSVPQVLGEQSGNTPAEVKRSEEKISKENKDAEDGDIENLINEKGGIQYDFQYVGLDVFQKTNAPPDKKVECIRLAKKYPQHINRSLSFCLDYPNPALKWKMFLWKINQLIKEEREKHSSNIKS